jgi:hypothetical protein
MVARHDYSGLMRQALRANPGKAPPTFTIQESAPVKGWMSQENFAEAEPQSAVILTNMFPEADAVRARRGHTSFATGMSGSVSSLLRYVPQGTGALFAAVGTAIYDVTAGGAVGAAAVSGLTNANWQQSMFATAAGQFMVICNGADGVRTYDGATWVDRTATITGTSGAVNTFINLTAHKKRLWFVASASMDLWFLATEAVAGAATKFPVGSLFKRGGYVMAMGTYSVDAGDGMDDLFVIVTSEGEVALYAGTDPTSATTWELIGVYLIGKPIGRRCLFQVGGDLLVINEDGILPISKAIKIDRAVAGKEAITASIRQAYVEAVKRSRTVQGWEIVAFPLRNMALLNVPGSGSTPTQQFAFNTITGAWALFDGMVAYCWAEFNGALYFGGTDKVFKAEYGANDNGAAIVLTALPAFSHLNAKGRLKHVKDMRFYISTDIPEADFTAAVAVNYAEPTALTGASTTPSGSFFQWDVTTWDGPSVWYGEMILSDWTGAGNIGTVVAPYLKMNLDAASAGAEFEFRWIATDFIYEPGGVL